jgi:parallel beta-helix repeat protein
MKYRLSLVLLYSLLNAVSVQGAAEVQALDNTKAHESKVLYPSHKITTPGVHKLQADLIFNGSNSAVEIDANDVVFDLNGYSIILNDPAATGVLVKNRSNFTILNGYIKNEINVPQRTGDAIKLTGAMQGTIQNISTFHHGIGIKIHRSHDVKVSNCVFKDSHITAALVQGSNKPSPLGCVNVQFDACTFRHAPHGVLCDRFNNKDLKITNCEFPDASQTDLLVKKVSGLVVENCNFTNKNANSTDADYKQNMVQFGDTGDNNWVNGVIMKNCTLINENPDNGWIEGLNIRQAYNVLVDSCTFNVSNWSDGIDEEIFPAAVHIGSWLYETYAFNSVIRNCVIGGFSLNGIFVDAGYSNTVEGCTISDTLLFGIYMWETESNTIKNNVISNNGYYSEDEGAAGLYIDHNCSYNAINNNSVNSNYTNGIINYGTYSIFQHNQSINNNNVGFGNYGDNPSSNVFVFNSAFDNCLDYDNISPVSIIGSSPTLSGENITPSNGGC